MQSKAERQRGKQQNKEKNKGNQNIAEPKRISEGWNKNSLIYFA